MTSIEYKDIVTISSVNTCALYLASKHFYDHTAHRCFSQSCCCVGLDLPPSRHRGLDSHPHSG
jgi:hypothetical protein